MSGSIEMIEMLEIAPTYCYLRSCTAMLMGYIVRYITGEISRGDQADCLGSFKIEKGSAHCELMPDVDGDVGGSRVDCAIME